MRLYLLYLNLIDGKNVLNFEVAFMTVWIKKVKLTWAVSLKNPLKECFLL